MTFDESTVAIGLKSFDGQTQIVELKTPRSIRGHTFDQIIFLKDTSDDEEWIMNAYAGTYHSKLERRITRLKTR